MIGALFGGLVAFRVPRAVTEDPPVWHEALRLYVERLELMTFDWRMKAYGEQATRSDEVVLATVDDDTLASAREATNPSLAIRPWPREVYGGLAEQALREGAGLLLLDVPLTDLSPRTCIPCKGEKAKSDDELLGARLEKIADKVVLPVGWSTSAPRPPDRELKPWMLKVAEQPLADPPPLEGVRRLLMGRNQAYLIPAGDKLQLWASALTEQRAQALSTQLEVKTPTIRAQTPDDAAFEVNQTWLSVKSAEITVEGIDPSKLTRARTLEGPVPALQVPGVVLGPARVVPDFDGEVRDFPHLVATELEGKLAVLASAPLLAAMKLTHSTHLRWFRGTLFIGDRLTVPMTEDGRSVLAWDAAEVGTGGRGTMKRAVPVWRLLLNLDDDDNKRGVRHHDNELSGRVVVLSEAGGQRVSTAIGRLPRGAVMAQALVNLLHGRSVTRTPAQLDFWITIAFAFGGALFAVAYASLFPRSGWVGYLAVIALIAVGVGYGSRAILISQLRWVPVVAPVAAASLTFLASLGYARTLERSLREFVTHALGRALPAQVLGSVERNTGLMKPERLPIAVYFSDIEGFTGLAQTIEPKVLVQMLQEYLSEMTQVVIDCRGQVDKYLGDGMMAFWGAPVRLVSPAKSACDAALKMRAKFERKRKGWEATAGAAMIFRSGLDVGETVVGEMGTEHRLNYTVMGESVATAAKLEALSKKYAAVILCTEAVRVAAGDSFVFREVDQVRFHRRDAPVRIYELLADAKSFSGGTATLLKWDAALELYRARKFAEARIAFALFAGAGADALATRYIKRCEMLQAVPPPEAWDGVFDGPE